MSRVKSIEPDSGWTLDFCADIEELEVLRAVSWTCFLCDQDLRYIYLLKHPETGDQIVVGRMCAERLTEDYMPNLKQRFYC